MRRSGSMWLAVGRAAAAVLALVASVVQLATVSWPLGVRVAIFAAVVLAATLWLVVAARPKPDHALAWSERSLPGERFLKLPRAGNTSFCELDASGRLTERHVPLAPAARQRPDESWPGRWWCNASGLHIRVEPYDLGIGELEDGVWAGTEVGPEGSVDFIGAVIDPRLPVPRRSWTGVKIGEYGVRRWFRAESDGLLVEHDPFAPEHRWEGQWRIDVNGLQIWVEEWVLSVQLRPAWQPGVYLGTEHSSSPDQGFAVVRVKERG